MPSSTASDGGAPYFAYRFLHRIESNALDQFLELEQQLMAAAKRFPGFRSETTPSCLGTAEDSSVLLYESVLTFDSLQHFIQWMDSRERRAILNPAEHKGYRYEGSSDWEGYSEWLSESIREQVPTWKTNLLVLLVLYPTVMILSLLLKPLPLDLPTGLLLGNICSVAITGWLLVPWASRLYRNWAVGQGSRRSQGLALTSILVTLFLMLQIFRVLPASIW